MQRKNETQDEMIARLRDNVERTGKKYADACEAARLGDDGMTEDFIDELCDSLDYAIEMLSRAEMHRDGY